MAVTPEGKIKAQVRKILDGEDIWYFMPVNYGGYGAATLDFMCSISFKGGAYSFSIETKAPSKKPTERQRLLIERLRNVGMKVFVIDGDAGLSELATWVEQIRRLNNGTDTHLTPCGREGEGATC
jgi:hypothetical protein